MKTMLGLADQEEAEGEGLLVGKLGMMTIPDGGAYGAALFREVFPTLVLRKPIHRITSFEKAPTLTALVHEFVSVALLLVLADGPRRLRTGYTANRFAGRLWPRYRALRKVAVAAETLKHVVREAALVRTATQVAAW